MDSGLNKKVKLDLNPPNVNVVSVEALVVSTLLNLSKMQQRESSSAPTMSTEPPIKKERKKEDKPRIKREINPDKEHLKLTPDMLKKKLKEYLDSAKYKQQELKAIVDPLFVEESMDNDSRQRRIELLEDAKQKAAALKNEADSLMKLSKKVIELRLGIVAQQEFLPLIEKVKDEKVNYESSEIRIDSAVCKHAQSLGVKKLFVNDYSDHTRIAKDLINEYDQGLDVNLDDLKKVKDFLQKKRQKKNQSSRTEDRLSEVIKALEKAQESPENHVENNTNQVKIG